MGPRPCHGVPIATKKPHAVPYVTLLLLMPPYFLLNQTRKEFLKRIVKENKNILTNTEMHPVDPQEKGRRQCINRISWRLNRMTSSTKPHPLRKCPEDQKTVRLYKVLVVSTCLFYSVMTRSLKRYTGTNALSQTLVFMTRKSANLWLCPKHLNTQNSG